jgi:hypothetical protein
MTAIVAFAQTGYAFLGGDTKRTMALFPASKLHSWSDTTLFGQAGNALKLTEAIGVCFKCQPQFGCGLDGLLTAFDQARKVIYPQAVAANSKGASGTLLIAHIGDKVHPAGLWTMEFDPAIPAIPVTTPIFGIGVSAIIPAANQIWDAARPAGPFSLGRWAMDSIESVVSPDVDWPVDMMISRPGMSPDARLVIRQRLIGHMNIPDAMFDHP